MRVLSSPRARRRLAWLGGVVLVAGAAASLALLLPARTPSRAETVSSAPAQIVAAPRRVALSAADRRAIAQTLDRFVVTAVTRRDPAAAYDLVTPAMRQGMTRAQWARGAIPVYPYPARGEHFRGWTSIDSYRDAVGFNLFLQPRSRQGLGPVGVRVKFRRLAGRWLVDSFVAEQSFPPAATEPAQATAKPSAAPPSTPGATRGRLSARWFVLPAALLGLFLAVALGFVLTSWRRNRRAVLAYRSAARRRGRGAGPGTEGRE